MGFFGGGDLLSVRSLVPSVTPLERDAQIWSWDGNLGKAMVVFERRSRGVDRSVHREAIESNESSSLSMITSHHINDRLNCKGERITRDVRVIRTSYE
ncbi:hypothetical protein EVAR_50517_1 [Eumeta japonica]|uniref:Uncharacterized protein n=1 Tax=Eumeta variegata TaxID=151549 RepID=A0A4C1X743_EUMVA|nr:hypothetical protein EVAR_50517_1 [Eumeta japonica]